MYRKRLIIVVLLIVLTIGIAGCNYDYKSIIPGAKNEQILLIKAEIHFNSQEVIDCYIKSLGIDQEADVYTGGSSLNYMYDKSGNIIGSYNYQNVLYIKVLSETTTGSD